MSCPRRNGIIICILLLCAAGMAVWLMREDPEPIYEGKTLGQWLENHTPTSSADPPYGSPGWHKANEALRAIGSNAVPTLLKMIAAKDPPRPYLKVMEFARSKRLIRWHYRYASSRNEEAKYAFEVLGTNAASAVPALIRIYERPRSRYSQDCAAQALGLIGRPATSAIPALLKNFSHTNQDVRFYAVSAAMHIALNSWGEPEVLISAFKNALKDPHKSVAWNALVGLSSFGLRARPALPDVLALADNPSLKKQVEDSLWRIAPEKVANGLVVAEATPVITNGVTAETIEAAFERKHLRQRPERSAFIKPGRSVPCLSQFFDSEPRYPISLYRTRDKTNSHLLGHFEVVGVPPTNANVGLLCVIADDKIFLCARDHMSGKFLAVRRIETPE